jgi:glyoxylate/succinic semialdehyde reductase
MHARSNNRFAVELGDKVAQPLPVSAAANEAFKRARQLGHDDADFSAVLEACLSAGRGKGGLSESKGVE